MSKILKKLRGGDRRSIGQANEVAHEVEINPALFESLFGGLFDDDPVVKMRSADAIEKATQNNPQLLSGYTSKIILILESAEQQEVCWHMAQIAPRLKSNASEMKKILGALKKYLLHKSKIVNVAAMDSLAIFAERDSTILDEVVNIIKVQMEAGSPAVNSRGRKLLGRLNKMAS